jgi:hypothetical protein
MEVDIRDIKSYVISLHDNISRKQQMINLFSKLELKNWSFFDAVDVRNKFPYWIGTGLSHYMVLDQAHYPCIVYEDDVATTEWGRLKINIPDDGITYLGLSSWGLKNGQSEHMGSVFEPINEEINVVKYMTGAHAIFYPSKECAKKFYDGILRYLFEIGRPFDEHYALMQTKVKTFGLNKPLFFQNCDRNTQYTYFKVN